LASVLVTGGAGFIGSHLCELLLDRGDDVSIIDNLSTGSYRNIAHLKDKKRFRITIGSILDNELLERMVERVDTVFHLAAVVGVQRIIDAPVDTIETNILGSHNVLNAAAKYHKLVLVASTSEVYGKAVSYPFREDDDTIYGPTTKRRWSYACSKAMDEFLALAYAQERGLPVIIARLFNTTGPRQTGRYGMVLPRFVAQALRGEPITVYGTGKQSRCFADVADVAWALLNLADEPKAIGRVFNVGNPVEISMADLAIRVKSITNSTSEIRFVPYDVAYPSGFEDMERRVPSIDRIAELIGFQPRLTLDETIRRVADGLLQDQPSVAEGY